MTKKILTLLLALILIFSLATTVFAEEEEILPCTGDQVTGTLVSMDEETNTATIDTGEDLCTVAFNQDYGHPITTLLASYFGNNNPGELAENLEATEVCLVQDEVTEVYSLYVPEEGEECPDTPGNVTGDNGDGTFQVVFGEGEEAEEITLEVEDEEQANGLAEALEGLNVEWNLNEDGSASDTGDQIAQYHDDGYGFGVIVKVYGIAEASQEACEAEQPEEPAEEGAPADEAPPSEEPCGVTPEELFELLENGASVGQLFKMFGKPSLLGVGHVRKNMKNMQSAEASMAEAAESTEEGGSEKDKSNKGICNARAKGGKAKAKGHGEVVCSNGGD